MSDGREISQHGQHQVATMPSVAGGGFVGWAKRGHIVGLSPLHEPGEPVWFDFAPTRDEVTAKLLREIGAAH